MGRVRGTACGRDGTLFLGHRPLRHAGRHHPLGDVAGRGHRHSRVRLDARAVDRLHPRAHARSAVARGGRSRSLSRLAGAGPVLRTGTAGDPAAARIGAAASAGEVRHPHFPRPGAGKRRGAAAPAPCLDRAMARGFALALALVPACLCAQRAGVLSQVDLPHAYYWREMYVPQATSGPSAVTWSPDGAELIYSMQGTLWRQRIGSPVATQLTSGPVYDYQPDWSPDGRSVVFARYAHDAIELELLDLASGNVTPLTANRAVNIEPRWSLDGSRIAFVASADKGRWQIFILSHVVAKDLLFSEPVRLTEDNDSNLPRYYYSKWDHYISPTWSPDGKEIILVSNRGHIHGTGGFWRMKARPGAPLRELRYEETTWKARPDWSPDGTRVIYSSYLGRQWNQLWLMTSEGGDPFPLTYGEFDATAPRWSRDGSRIAFVSNESGNTSLWVMEIRGAKKLRIEASQRRYQGVAGTLHVSVVDRAGRPIPARISVTTAEGRGYAPDDAWRQADEAFDRSERQFEYPYFHSSGSSELTVPAGQVHVEIWHGPEYRVYRADVNVPTGGRITQRVTLQRVANLPGQGWWSGDVHVHMNYGGAYRKTPEHLALQARAEDLHVVEHLIENKEQRLPDIAYFRTNSDPTYTPP